MATAGASKSLSIRTVRATYCSDLPDRHDKRKLTAEVRRPSAVDDLAIATLDLEALEKLKATATARTADRKRKSLQPVGDKGTDKKFRRITLSGVRRSSRRHVATIFAPCTEEHFGGEHSRASSPNFALYSKTVTSKDPAMQQRLDYELKMRDGAAKLLSAAASAKYSTTQCLEAAKTLIVSSMRMASYADSLQQLHGKRPLSRNCSRQASVTTAAAGTAVTTALASDATDAAAVHLPMTSTTEMPSTEIVRQRSLPDENQLPSKATVAVSEIRIPLMWKDTDHFKNRGTHRRFALFCVAQIGTIVQETGLVFPVDRSYTDVCFDECLIMENVPHDFKCKLIVYAHELCDDLSIASTQLKIRKKITSISSSIGRRLSGTGMKENVEDTAISGPRFDVVAQAELSLKDCKDNAGIHDLVINSESDFASGLPLFGNFCCRIVAQPYCLTKDVASNYLFVKETEHAWHRYWCVLKNLKISCWDTPFEADLEHEPLLTIPITKDSLIVDAHPSSADRPYMFHVRSVSRTFDDRDLAAENADALKNWWAALECHLLDQVVWAQACETLATIKAPQLQHRSLSLRNSGSLYDKTAVKGVGTGCKGAAIAATTGNHDGSPLTLMLNRLTRDECSPKSPILVRKTSRH